MASHRETVEIVDKFLELTQHGDIKWESSSPPYNLIGPDVRIELVYTTNYLNRNLRLYIKKYKYFTDESEYHWDERVVLEFIDESGNSLFDFPQTSNSWDLVKAIKYQNSDIKNFYKEMFNS